MKSTPDYNIPDAAYDEESGILKKDLCLVIKYNKGRYLLQGHCFILDDQYKTFVQYGIITELKSKTVCDLSKLRRTIINQNIALDYKKAKTSLENTGLLPDGTKPKVFDSIVEEIKKWGKI